VLGGRLSPIVIPSLSDPTILTLLRNPFYICDQAGLTQNSGWFDAWRSAPSAYVVAAESATDVAAAIGFARTHNVKGGGHSYFGASGAPDSLLIPAPMSMNVTTSSRTGSARSGGRTIRVSSASSNATIPTVSSQFTTASAARSEVASTGKSPAPRQLHFTNCSRAAMSRRRFRCRTEDSGQRSQDL
jgi:hypothetical protein